MKHTINSYLESLSYKINKFDRDKLEEIKEHWKTEFQTQTWKTNIYLIGNGGSLSICEHISTDLNKRCNIRAHTLSNTSMITALGNDYGYDNIYSKWLEMNRLSMYDYVVAVSSSGKSANIAKGLQYASERKSYTLTIFGMDGEPIIPENRRNKFMHIDSQNYGIVELASEIMLHSIVEDLVLE